MNVPAAVVEVAGLPLSKKRKAQLKKERLSKQKERAVCSQRSIGKGKDQL